MTKIASRGGRLAVLTALVGSVLYGCASGAPSPGAPETGFPSASVPVPAGAELAVGRDAPGYDHGARFYTYTSPLPPNSVLANYERQLEASGFALVRREGAWYVFAKDGFEVGVQVPNEGPPSTLIVRIDNGRSQTAGASGTPDGSPGGIPGLTFPPSAFPGGSRGEPGVSAGNSGATPDPPTPGASERPNVNGGSNNGGSNNGGSNNGTNGNGGSNNGTNGNGGSNNGGSNNGGSSNGGNGNGNGNANGGNGNNGNGGNAAASPPAKPDPPHGKPSASPKPTPTPRPTATIKTPGNPKPSASAKDKGKP